MTPETENTVEIQLSPTTLSPMIEILMNALDAEEAIVSRLISNGFSTMQAIESAQADMARLLSILTGKDVFAGR